MKLFARSKKKPSRTAAYARPRWVDMSQINTEGQTDHLRVDLEALAERSFITRDTMEGSLAREFSLIKRRLFRRLDYFNHSKDGRRQGKDERCPLVLVSSSKPGEGKTFSACNLALSLAFEEQVRVLLIDADLAKPSIPGVFGFDDNLPGLFDCLNDPKRVVWNDIQKVARTRLSILPSGQATASPASLLGGDAMLKMLDQVSHGPRAFEFVVMDGPPLLATTEALVLAQHADQIMLVVGAGEVTTTQIKSSLEMLGSEDKINLMINLMPIGEPLPTDYSYAHRRESAA